MYATETQPFYDYTIDNSLLFDGNSSYMSRTGVAGNGQKWTWSAWVKNSANKWLFSAGNAYTNRADIFIGSASLSGAGGYDDIVFYLNNGTAQYYMTTAKFRDVSGWYHIVVAIDGSLGADDKAKIYVNGVRQATTRTSVSFTTTPVNTAINHLLGISWTLGAGTRFDGYLADTYLIDGLALDPTAFGEFKSGIWVPKAYTGAYGNNGHHLDFADGTSATTLGYDVSGNSNNFTPSGIASTDQMLDSPTNNFCTLNPIDPGTTGTLSEGNLVTSGNAKVTIRPTTGQWYYEKDGVGVSYDANTSGEFNPTLTAGTYNFGQRPWADVGPTGSQKALCTANLPDPTFFDPRVGASPQDHFSVDLDADGSGALTAAQAVFPTGIWWLKNRTTTGNSDHLLVDSARGSTLELNPNSASAESTYSDPGGASVAWSWKAASAVSGTTTGSGTLKSYSGYANATAGVSVITYEGNGTAGHQIPHHLATVPSVVIVKSRDEGTRNWIVYHANTGAFPEAEHMVLNGTAAVALVSLAWNNTAPSASVVTLGSYAHVNNDTYNNIMYAFAEKDGFSKFGVYQGNFNADGPFVYLGFRPAFVMIKATGGTTGKWCIFDAERDGYNVDNDALHVYPTAAEDTTDQIDMLSNGFKIRGTGTDVNNSTYEYIYMAFSEQPFKYSNAR
jgi:hypothetical protein